MCGVLLCSVTSISSPQPHPHPPTPFCFFWKKVKISSRWDKPWMHFQLWNSLWGFALVLKAAVSDLCQKIMAETQHKLIKWDSRKNERAWIWLCLCAWEHKPLKHWDGCRCLRRDSVPQSCGECSNSRALQVKEQQLLRGSEKRDCAMASVYPASSVLSPVTEGLHLVRSLST